LATCAYGFGIWRSLARELPGDLKLQSQRTALESTLALDAAWSGLIRSPGEFHRALGVGRIWRRQRRSNLDAIGVTGYVVG